MSAATARFTLQRVMSSVVAELNSPRGSTTSQSAADHPRRSRSAPQARPAEPGAQAHRADQRRVDRFARRSRGTPSRGGRPSSRAVRRPVALLAVTRAQSSRLLVGHRSHDRARSSCGSDPLARPRDATSRRWPGHHHGDDDPEVRRRLEEPILKFMPMTPAISALEQEHRREREHLHDLVRARAVLARRTSNDPTIDSRVSRDAWTASSSRSRSARTARRVGARDRLELGTRSARAPPCGARRAHAAAGRPPAASRRGRRGPRPCSTPAPTSPRHRSPRGPPSSASNASR